MMTIDHETRIGATTQSLLEQAVEDDGIAAAIVMAAACIEAAEAYGAADPALELERRLGGFRSAAREALAEILRREGEAA